MNKLNKIVAYWHDCIKNEDILEKDISIYVRKKAVLYPFDQDPFIFDKKENRIPFPENEKLSNFDEYINMKDFEAFYGYPILFYEEEDEKRITYKIAPLFIIKIKFFRENKQLYIQKDEPYPTCGIQALSTLGLRTEEISDISQTIEKILKQPFSSKKLLAEECIKAIEKEAAIQINEEIDPDNLSNSRKISKNMTSGLYNKSLIFAGENTAYNINLLQDLHELKNKNDLDKTALSFLLEEVHIEKGNEIVPILPFPSNEYQIKALQEIFNNKLSVITGPPGTGKSQYISNLLTNLFHRGNSVLFVSHTNEAVNVVNRKINEQFRNLMLRTGKKDYRQELKGKFNELIQDSQKIRSHKIHYRELSSLWEKIIKYRNKLLKLDELERRFDKLFHLNKSTGKSLVTQNIFLKFGSLIKKILIIIKIKRVENKLRKFPPRLKIEREIKTLEKKYYEDSREFIRSIYIKKIVGKGRRIGKVKYFLNEVDSRRLKEECIEEHIFLNALEVLKVWASTLKSIRRTFPLSPGIFDYVIFDEASQVDLPSAAPALYRAKRAIVVGDPMQLTHVAGITREIDKEIAKNHGLIGNRDIYPSKTRYCDVSLYKSAEHSLNHMPILLTNHYRSEDQIISLCNKAFYEGRLKIMTTLDYSQYPENLPLGVNWIDCKGGVFKHPGGSRFNREEADLVNKIFHNVLEKIDGTKLSIGVVTPYSRQQDLIYDKISQSTSTELIENHNVKVLTAHKFQGTEKDIMIFSLVLASRGNAKSDRWYNIYPQILNVALSRAKYLLYIVGDKEFCQNRPGVLNRLIKTYDDIKNIEEFEKQTIYEKFDSPAERLLFEKLQNVDFEKYGYELIPKLVVKRYTLDFALMGTKKIDIECDGFQHEIIEGMPIIDDVERDAFMEKEGWEVLRFPNHRIISQTDEVIRDIISGL